MDTPLTSADQEAVRQDVLEYCNDHNITDAKLARQVSYSPSVISQWLKGKYEGDNETVTRAINHWMEEDFKSRNARVQVNYVSTRVAEEMHGAVQAGVEMNMMVALIAPGGAGKTTLMQTLSQRKRGFLIYGHEDMSPHSFYSDVAVACGARLESGRARNNDLLRAIVGKLKGTRRILFIDEGHRIPKLCFARVRTVYDMTGCTIVLAGTSEMLGMINDRAAERGQLASRFIVYNATDATGTSWKGGGSQADQQPLWTVEEIAALYDKTGVKFHPAALQMLWAIACDPNGGTIREVKRIVDVIVKTKPGQVITRKDVIQAKAEISGRQGEAQIEQANRYLEDRRIA